MIGMVSNVQSIADVQAVESKQNNLSIKKSKNDDSMNIVSKDSVDDYNKKNPKTSNDSNVFGDTLKKVSYKYNNKTDSKVDVSSKKKNIKEVKNDDEELEEKIEKLSTDDIMQLLKMITQLLNKDNNISSEEMNKFTELLGINFDEFLNSNLINNNVSENLAKSDDIFSNLLSALEAVNENDEINAGDLKLIKELVNEAAERLNDNSEQGKVLAPIQNKLDELLNSTDKKGEELSLENSSLNNVYKNIADENSGNANEKSGDSNDSKDNKVLESILNDDKNSVPVFTTNTIVNNVNGTVTEVKEVVNATSIAKDIIQDVKYMSSNDVREMIVKVNPGNLGEITIRLVEEDGAMKLHMKATSKETYGLLVQQSSDIKNQLSEQNIKIHDVNISLYEEDTTFFKDGEFSNSFDRQNESKGNRRNFMSNGIITEDEESEDDMYDLNSLNLLV